MSLYDTLKTEYGNAAPEKKLLILRHEMLRPINRIESASAALEMIATEATEGLPEDFTVWVSRLSNAVEEMKEILDALTLE